MSGNIFKIVLEKILISLLSKPLLDAIKDAIRRGWRARVTISLLLFFASYGVKMGIEDTIKLISTDRSQYGFEDTTKGPGWITGWIISNNQPICTSSACALSSPGILTNPDCVVKGKASMRVHVTLDGTIEGRNENKHQGEVFVDPTRVCPREYCNKPALTYINISNKTLRASLIIPLTLVEIEKSKPIYVQLFLEDCGVPPKRYDLPSRNIGMAGRLDLENNLGPAMNRICKIGIKIGLNTEDTNTYEGYICVDAVDW